jgi:hypothetical protein
MRRAGRRGRPASVALTFDAYEVVIVIVLFVPPWTM